MKYILILLSLLSATVSAHAARITASEEELKRYPLEKDLPGKPARDGLRYWKSPFTPINHNGAYVSAIQRNGEHELWRGSLVFRGTNTQGRLAPLFTKASPEEKVCIVSRGPAIDRLGEGEPRFDSSLINDVFDPGDPNVLSPERGFTRTSMSWYPDIGYVFYCCVTHAYSPGAVRMLPALYTSGTGEQGSWRYHGKFKGEPLELAKDKVIWSDGGSMHRLENGRWRAYANGYGQVAAAMESDSLDGEWTFIRDRKGNIRELLPDFPKSQNRSGCWVHALRVAEQEWHLWLTDTWPAQAIWHFSSKDGLRWKPYGKQPELTRLAVGGHGIKCMRTYLDGDEIVGLLSVYGEIPGRPKGWVLHESRMATGLKPQKSK